MSDTGYGDSEDRSITITTPEGKEITWTPRSYTLLPQCLPAPTRANSPTEQQNPESWSNGFYGHSGFVSPSGKIPSPKREGKREGSEKGKGEGKRGNKIEKVLQKIRTLKSKFTHRLRLRGRYFGKRASSTKPQIFNTTSQNNIALPTGKTKKGIMNRLRDFWKPVNDTDAGRKPNKLVKKERTRNRFTHKSGATSDPESTLADDSTYKQILENPLTTSKPIMVQRRHSDTTDGSMSCQPPSALDCEHTRRARHYEEQAREMIMSSFSTTDGHLGEQAPDPKCKHKSWRSCCKCNFSRNRGGSQNEEQDPDPSGQGGGNTGIPKDAEYLITYSESEESLVNIAVENPHINNSLVLRKTYDLRELDSYLTATNQCPGNIHNSRLRSQGTAQRQREVDTEADESDDSDQNEEGTTMATHSGNSQVEMEDEISDLDISGSSSPFFHSFDGQVLRKRLRHLSKLNTSLSGLEPDPESPTDLVSQQPIDVDEVSKKTLSLDINESAIVSAHKNEEKKLKDNTVEEELEEAMNTPLPEPKDGEVAQAIMIQGGARRYTVPAINSSYVDVCTGSYLSPSAKHLCTAHPLIDDHNIEYHSGEDSPPPSPRIGNYPALDSSATSLDFGFRPTLESMPMPGSWPDESEYVNIHFQQKAENKEEKTWRDYSATDLPMGRADTQISPFARCREVQESCRPPMAFGRDSEESGHSVKAH